MTMYIKRSSARKSLDADIRASVSLESLEPTGKKFYDVPARLKNQSDEGMYIEVGHRIQPESKISIKMIPPNSEPLGAYKLHRGRVRWCRLLETKAASKYGVGIQVYETVIQAALHLSHPDLS